MKLLKLFGTLLLLTLVSCQGDTATTVKGGSCKNGCVSCRTNGETEWCLACYKSKHVMTTAIDGKCEGTASGISNCIISFAFGSDQLCIKCDVGYALVINEEKAETAADGKNQRTTGYTCKEIPANSNSVIGTFKKTKTDSSTQYFFAEKCKYGYIPTDNGVDAISETKGSTCQPSDSSFRGYDKNCFGYTSSSTCSVCKDGYVKVLGKCQKIHLNSAGISTSATEPYFGKWSSTCNSGAGFYLKDGDIKPKSFSLADSAGSKGIGFYPSTSVHSGISSISYGCYGCRGVCTSKELGTVGDGKFKPLIGFLVGICLFVLFK